MTNLRVGDKVLFQDEYTREHFATVTRVARGVATIKYYVKGTSAVSYVPKTEWDRLTVQDSKEKASFAQMRWDSYYEGDL